MILNILIYILLISFFYMTVKKWNYIKESLNLKNYSQSQKVHKNDTPRIGGIIVYIFLWIFYFLNHYNNDLFFNILISSIPFFIISTLEDLYQNTSPAIRIFSMIISSIIFFSIQTITLPEIDFPFISDFLSLFPINYIFFIFSIIVIMNGSNLIDGMNGLLLFTLLFQLMSLYFLFSLYNDSNMLYLLKNIFLIYIVFLIFNYPFGKIFLGDFGAYFIGFMISLITIYFFGEYPNEYTWIAVLILFYPSIELLFSFIRKKRIGLNPLYPDTSHIHSIIFKKLHIKLKNLTKANYTTTIFLMPLWLLPFLLLIYFSNTVLNIFISILFLSIIYLLIYNFFKKKN